ncbi:kinesin family protein [Histoplasma capsulatum G186AR]|uniref:Kinesin family protein n=2 Tax=Ajellomyces capsulatus TaxID=5037 RepID=C0NH71_AJECG|nr:kinesin family protein [Histoplasma capsulatum G186AR]EEH09156.1 kinesin family protein [Histoplasma capsulatum G186AR]KAG5303517.1 kinesin family protein [Histoplasma capsulatum]QSS69114.1 kinesin family protein [Histoplasma capsulatum G186AR]
MSVRVIARIRPLLKSEKESDIIVRSGTTAIPAIANTRPPAASLPQQQLCSSKSDGKSTTTTALKGKRQKDGANAALALDRDNLVRIPNPKNEGEEYSFQFNGVYGPDVSQQEIFDGEVAPTIKHLFNGFDVTIFAYGVTGTGKTHTMRGGKSLQDRGVIPRLLSGIYRRSRKVERDSQGATKVDVVMSYYEIYNDKVFDLFEPPEKRTPAGLPLRDAGGKTVVVGLTERPCTSLKEFEMLYDHANVNRSTSATKLNAHSSRSHAILCVKLVVTTAEQTRVSLASCIDLAGSEDNRRTDNDKERMVESASINKSLFVLAQCVEAISKKQSRIPYRESKMTRILSLGQNNGLTIMILNLAPIRSYHLDTLSSLNFANRTKKIEVREIENEPMFKGPPRPTIRGSGTTGPVIHRQPLRPLTASINANIVLPTATDSSKPAESKPVKAFSVYSDKLQSKPPSNVKRFVPSRRSSPLKLRADASGVDTLRPSKVFRPVDAGLHALEGISAAKIEEMVERKVEAVLAARALNEAGKQRDSDHSSNNELNEQVQRRLELLEQRIEGKSDARAEGLSYLLMGKQHQSRGEDSSALRMYQLAQPFFPCNEKLDTKIKALKEKLVICKGQVPLSFPMAAENCDAGAETKRPKKRKRYAKDESFNSADHVGDVSDSQPSDPNEQFSDEETAYPYTQPSKRPVAPNNGKSRKPSSVPFPYQTPTKKDTSFTADEPTDVKHTPRTHHIISTINTRNVDQIKLLRGVGIKKAEAIVDCLCEMDTRYAQDSHENNASDIVQIRSLAELGKLKGVGAKTVENMRNAI